MSQVNYRKKTIKNVFWSFLSTIISTAVLQLIVYPVLASRYSEAMYGQLLFIMGIVNVLILTMGNAIGDLRLTENAHYESQNIKGDFNYLLIRIILFTAVIFLVFNFYNLDVSDSSSIVNTILLSITLVLGLMNAYLFSLLRLRLQFREGVISNMITAVGYAFGLLLLLVFRYWPIPFLAGFGFSVPFLIYVTKPQSEAYQKTTVYAKTRKKYIQLAFAYAIKSSLNYLDRFILAPMIGLEMVAVYTVASIFGKTLTVAIQPIANVALGYYSQTNFNMTVKRYWKTNGMALGLAVIALVVTSIVGEYFIKLIYPSYYAAVLPYLFIANFAAILAAVSGIVHPAVLKFSDQRWQVILQAVYAVLFIGLSIWFIRIGGLMGFCYAAVIANTLKLVLMLYIGHRGVKKIVRDYLRRL